jgi:hypothetical protein
MSGAQTKSGGKKIGRNKVECQRYRARRTRERNKLRKLRKHIKRYPGDAAARRALPRVAEELS